ncbi:unnamed protein product [Wickerhamomyces anomalus]
MSIAEQMGITLQLTSISTNIKERLDFSCALFNSDGKLLANAPHIPGHLGSMFLAVEKQLGIWKGQLKKGDVVFTNAHTTGGTHLPDQCLPTPKNYTKKEPLLKVNCYTRKVYSNMIKLLIYYTLNLVNTQDVQGQDLLDDCISDLKAHASANNKGLILMQNLINEFGLDVVHLYSNAIQKSAEAAVRDLLKIAYDRFGGEPLKAVDYLDDGTAIAVTITIDREDGSAILDFTESGDQFYSNLNCPIAVLYGSILYVLRCLINVDIPLNSGCMQPLDIRVREGSLFMPSPDAAVAGSNVETAQRISDTLFKAFQACAASQGTCNNFTFGSSDPQYGSFGYYETIAGGGGAGENFHGQSAVQVHTTNTRMTDSESFEKKFPCILRKYEINRGTGGKGLYKGGDGVIREIEFTIPIRSNLFNAKTCGQNTVFVKAGDRIRIETPSGGGWGVPIDEQDDDKKSISEQIHYPCIDAPFAKPTILTGSIGMKAITQTTNSRIDTTRTMKCPADEKLSKNL